MTDLFTIRTTKRVLEAVAAHPSVKDRIITLADTSPTRMTARDLTDLSPVRTLRGEVFHVQRWADGRDRYLMLVRLTTGEHQRVPDSPEVMVRFGTT